MAYTTNPLSISASSTGPCGTSIATATTLAAPALERSQLPSSARPAPHAGTPALQLWCLEHREGKLGASPSPNRHRQTTRWFLLQPPLPPTISPTPRHHPSPPLHRTSTAPLPS